MDQEKTNLDTMIEYGFTPTDLYVLGQLRAYESIERQRDYGPKIGYV